ncbi:bifunctional DNA-formamidopyrimidine glycosylase/DNA-(apurinic or apyrimidinic site) lyase [Cysteiniphilum halobium]|uniref:bifunctional DNA-formamidopyrimidine glycosylase/DNA-(apurinic or apyrimidinic site) lyase n=1 Tax=Cysteiniphilum halobium TaxID=2219059 RepID=UPI000E65BA89|nr:bifunctional DNA-formamidopyrimidine glycosylase/DNA-(apurinic or apyrimidinic site) lyase [Cysteiniphilum halobium]
MPELPEVETVKNGLSLYCLKRKIIKAHTYIDKLRYPLDPKLSQKITHQSIRDISRRGKHLIIALDDYSLIIHLGMSGVLQIIDSNMYQHKKHDHIILQLDDGQTIFYHDPRRFGYWDITDSNPLEHKYFLNYGPEPLTQHFNSSYLQRVLKARTQAIKSVIMDNKIVVGVGNIYACESLFKTGISPLKPANTLTKNEINKLVNAIQSTLLQAIKAGGTTLKDYKNATGKPGYFAQSLQVYGQKDQPCQICLAPIESIVINQRNTFYCPQCQR